MESKVESQPDEGFARDAVRVVQETAASIPESVLDPRNPWKLPRLESGFPTRPYRMIAAEWGRLLHRAKEGDAEAQWEVAERYFDGCKNGSGRVLVNRSPRKGFEWLQRAVEGGLVEAQNNLGVLLGNEENPHKDLRKALVWLKRASRGKDGSAAYNMAVTYRQLGNFRRAFFWFRKSASSGDDSARVQLGIHYYWGIGVGKNAAAAIRCFRKAIRGANRCEYDRDDAFFYLAIAYLQGNGVKPSIPIARGFLERANVDNDHPASQRLLSRL